MRPNDDICGAENRFPDRDLLLCGRRRLIRAWLWGLALAGLSLLPALATTVVPPSFDELVERADTVFEGRVTAIRSKWVGQGDARRIKTEYTFAVDEVLKGSAAATYTLEVLGGTVGDVTLTVGGSPDFAVGDRVLLFVTRNRTQFVPLVGVMHGHYKFEQDPVTKRDRVVRHDGSALQDEADVARPMGAGMKRLRVPAASSQTITPEAFKDKVRAKVRSSVP